MAEIFTPFLTAFILAYALRPVCLWLERHKLPRAFAAALAMLFGLTLIFLILSLLIGLLKYEIPLIRAQIPNWITNT
jgi:predicted PurR-regulated permease PerM